MTMLDLEHSVDVFKVYILVAERNLYKLSYTSKLFSFVRCSHFLHLFLYVFQQTVQYSPLFPGFFTTQWPIYLVCEFMVYGIDIVKTSVLNLKMDPAISINAIT